MTRRQNIQVPEFLVRRESRFKSYRRFLVTGLGISLALHVSIFLTYFLATREPEQKIVKIQLDPYDMIQPPIKFDVKEPRMSKSIESIKEATVSATFVPREFQLAPPVAAQAAEAPTTTSASTGVSRGGEGSVFYGAMTGGSSGAGGADWALPGGATSYGRSFGVGGSGGWGAGLNRDLGSGPNITTEVTSARTGSGGISSLKENLISYENFRDRFEAFVFQNPKNKKKIQGYLNFYQLEYSSSGLEQVASASNFAGWQIVNNQPSWNCIPLAIPNLAKFIKDSTQLDVALKGTIRLDAREVLAVPMLYMMGFQKEPRFTKEELANLTKYLRNGGFLFVDDCGVSVTGVFNKKMRLYLEQVLGYDAVFERIPQNHQLFHVWEDFNGPAPGDDEVRNFPGRPVQERYRYLEGIFIQGRLVVLFSSKGYGMAWGAWPINPGSVGGPIDNTRQLQFGVNAIVFACTQKGGIVDRNRQVMAASK